MKDAHPFILEHVKGQFKEVPIKDILYKGTAYYIKNVSNKHVKLNCSTFRCTGVVDVLFTKDGHPTTFLDGGRLDMDNLQCLPTQSHRTNCDINPILACESHDFLHAMMRDLTLVDKIKREGTKPNSTIGYYKQRRATWRKAKPNKKGWFNEEFRNINTIRMPPLLTSHGRGRFYNDEGGKKDDELDAIRSLFEVETRLDMLAAKVDCTGEDRDKFNLPSWVGLCVEESSNMVSQSITMNAGKLDGDALVPLFIIEAKSRRQVKKTTTTSRKTTATTKAATTKAATTKAKKTTTSRKRKTTATTATSHRGKSGREKTTATKADDLISDVSLDVNGNILVNKKRLSYNCTWIEGDLEVAIPKNVDRDECRTRVFVDTNNILKNGKDFGYIRIGDCLDAKQLDAAYELSKKISPKKNQWKNLPFVLLACCRFKYNTGKSKKAHSEFKEKWTRLEEKKTLDELISSFKEFIRDFRQSVVENFDPTRKKELLKILARFTW